MAKNPWGGTFSFVAGICMFLFSYCCSCFYLLKHLFDYYIFFCSSVFVFSLYVLFRMWPPARYTSRIYRPYTMYRDCIAGHRRTTIQPELTVLRLSQGMISTHKNLPFLGRWEDHPSLLRRLCCCLLNFV